MEDGTGNTKPSWQHSAYKRASAAAEPGSPCFLRSAAFPNEPIGDHTNLNHPFFAENDRVSLVGYGHYNAYEPFATPGNYAHANNHPFAPFVNPNPSPFTASTSPARAACNGGLLFQTASNPYSLGGGGSAADSNSDAFAPFVNSNPSPLNGSTYAAGAAYNNGIALPTAPSPYTWTPAAPTGPMDPFMGAGFQHPDPTLPMMTPFATTPNGIGNNYPGPSPTTGLDTQMGVAIDPPAASLHAAAINTDPSYQAPARPTCTTCAQSFTRKADLDRHAKKHGDDGDRFFCAVEGCAYGGSHRKDKLVEHVRRRHPGLGVGAVGRG